MEDFTAHRLTVACTVDRPIALNEHKGSALRGALYHGLRGRFCTMAARNLACSDCPLWEACPVCTLVSTLAEGNRLGPDAARPYTVQPPPAEERLRYDRGEPFVFGLTLYADAMRLFPYVVMALQNLEEGGLGRRGEANDWRRGTLRVERIWAENPLSGERQAVLRGGEQRVRVPDVGINHRQVCAAAERLAPGRLAVELLTPTRLIERKRLVKPGQVRFAVLLARLLDRLESLAQQFSATPLRLDYRTLVQAAEGVRLVGNRSEWVELRSYSTRQRRATPIGGLVGRLTFEAEDWAPFAPWLVWGQFTHVGKDAVKGNGWYRLEG